MGEAAMDGVELQSTARLRTVIGQLSRSLRRTRAGAELTSTETSVLGATVRNGPVGLSQLAAAEGMNPTMLSRVVGRLEDGGLVVRQPSPTDGRASFVEATAEGRRLDQQIRTERTDALNVVVEQLGSDERRALFATLPVLEHIANELKRTRIP